MNILSLIGFCDLLVGFFLFFEAETLRSVIPAYQLPSEQALRLFAIAYIIFGFIALVSRFWGTSQYRVRELLCYFHLPFPLLMAGVLFTGDWNALAVFYLAGPSLIWWMPLILESTTGEFDDYEKQEVEASWLKSGTAQEVKAALLEHSEEETLVVVFLRHFGCVFCKELLENLKDYRKSIESSGSRLVLVHLLDEVDGRSHLHELGFSDVDAVSDPHCELYKSFGIKRASILELFSPIVLMRFFSVVVKGFYPSSIKGDPLQLSGIVVLSKGRVARSYLQRKSSDHADLSVCVPSKV